MADAFAVARAAAERRKASGSRQEPLPRRECARMATFAKRGAVMAGCAYRRSASLQGRQAFSLRVVVGKARMQNASRE